MLEYAVVRSEMEDVLPCENDVQFDALTVLLILQCFMWFASHFTVGVTRRLLLWSRVSSLVITLLTF